MKKMLAAGLATWAALTSASIRADDPNPDVAKTIQEIAARRAAKEEARAKQYEEQRKNMKNMGGGGAAGAAPAK
jgi:hypothetical protein